MSIITQKRGTLEYLIAEEIAVPHGFTTRLGGVSTGHLDSLNLGLHRGDDPKNVLENYRILSDAIGFDPEKLVATKQIHSDIVRPVSERDWGIYLAGGPCPQCDALITNTPGTALAVFTADCTPILLWDHVNGAVGAAHAGWRGTAADIAGKTVAAMVDQFGCDAENIHAAIGPNIGPCCFETDLEVPQAMLATFGNPIQKHLRSVGEKYYVNLKEINAHALRRAGITHIAISPECTMCSPHRFWSHRYTHGLRGAQVGLICCKEVQP